jgi:hypothetical protein
MAARRLSLVSEARVEKCDEQKVGEKARTTREPEEKTTSNCQCIFCIADTKAEGEQGREKGTGLRESDSRLIYMILRVKLQERGAFGENKWGLSRTNRTQSSDPWQESRRVGGQIEVSTPQTDRIVWLGAVGRSVQA